MSMTGYGKMMFRSSNGEIRLIQPKSYTCATGEERKEMLELLIDGEYVVVPVALPVSTFHMREKE